MFLQGIPDSVGRIHLALYDEPQALPGASFLNGLLRTREGYVAAIRDKGQSRVFRGGMAFESQYGFLLADGIQPPFHLTSGILVDDNGALARATTRIPEMVVNGVGMTKDGLLCVVYTEDNPPPEPEYPKADFEVKSIEKRWPYSVEFSNKSTGTIYQWSWDFGDGKYNQEENPVHIYTQSGQHEVLLALTGFGEPSVKKQTITIEPVKPVADFTTDVISGHYPLQVIFENHMDGEIDTWVWDFGDGHTGHARHPTHTYESAGEFNVSLTVTGPGGSDTVKQVIQVTTAPPVTDFRWQRWRGVVPFRAKFINKTKGIVDQWLWDFGDGETSTEETPTHLYKTAGRYTVRLAATGPGGEVVEEKSNCIVVLDAPPVASFGSDKTFGDIPFSIQFEDKSEGTIEKWYWSFGDGSVSWKQSPSHLYDSPGTYDVSLTVKGPGGRDRKRLSKYVEAKIPPPIASFTAVLVGTPVEGQVPVLVEFIDTSTGRVDELEWDFGDDTLSTETSPRHMYKKRGQYTVTLTARGPGGTDEIIQKDYIRVG